MSAENARNLSNDFKSVRLPTAAGSPAGEDLLNQAIQDAMDRDAA
jgi:hypothetical protein